MRLVHITDPHTSSLTGVPARTLFGKRLLGYVSWRRKRRAAHRQELLQTTTRHLLAADPDVVVLTGDLLHIGLAQEMRELRSWLQELSHAVPVFFVPGNHDHYRTDSAAALQATWGDLPMFGTAPLQPDASWEARWPTVLDLPGVRLIGLNSAYAAPVHLADGRLETHQLQRLEALLASAGERRSVIAIHHPVARAGVPARKSLRDAPALTALLERYLVGEVLHGHLHENWHYMVGPTNCYCTASCARIPMAYRLFDYAGNGAPYTELVEL